MNTNATLPLAAASSRAARAATDLLQRACAAGTRITATGRKTSPLAGRAVLLEDGVGRELQDVAIMRAWGAGTDGDRKRWVIVAVALRGAQGRERGRERVLLPDTRASVVLAAELDARASDGRLAFCTSDGARSAVAAILGDCARRDLGLF